jgi:hypothetical protein
MSPYADMNHEPWPGLLDSVPKIFQRYVREPAFRDENDVPMVTVCLWHASDGDRWQVGEVDYSQGTSDTDGSAYLFRLLTNPSAEAFQRFAEDYYETPIDLEVVQDVYRLDPGHDLSPEPRDPYQRAFPKTSQRRATRPRTHLDGSACVVPH